MIFSLFYKYTICQTLLHFYGLRVLHNVLTPLSFFFCLSVFFILCTISRSFKQIVSDYIKLPICAISILLFSFFINWCSSSSLLHRPKLLCNEEKLLYITNLLAKSRTITFIVFFLIIFPFYLIRFA